MELKTKRIFKKVLGLFLAFSIMVPYLTSGVAAQATPANTAILNNGKLKIGDGSSASINAEGTLNQPSYYDTNSSTWYELTLGNYPMSYAIGAGGDGSSEWNTNGSIVSDMPMANQVIDTSAYVSQSASQGYGTIVSTGDVTVSGKVFEIKNTYSLENGKSFIKATTKITNKSGSNATNVRFWVGVPDDCIAGSDINTKVKGNVVNGVFTPIANMADKASTLEVSSSGTAVLFFTNKANANTVVSYLGMASLYSQDPALTPITQTSDNSYGIYTRLNDLANNESDDFTWYYAAGDVASIASIANEISQASENVQINVVNPLKDITVSNGTDIDNIGLPETIDVKLSDSKTTSVAVTWDNGDPDYNGDVAGIYKFTGTLSLPNGVTNPSSLTASLNVIVGSKQVKSVEKIEDKTVENGTYIDNIGLPETIDVKLSDSKTTSVAVTWNNGSPPYDGDTADIYKFTGILKLPDGVTNTNDYKAVVFVTVKAAQSVITTPASVTIKGTEEILNTLSAEFLDKDKNAVTTDSAVTYEWYRLDDSNSSFTREIGTSKTYDLTNDDLGKYIGLSATYAGKSFTAISGIIQANTSNNNSGSSSKHRHHHDSTTTTATSTTTTTDATTEGDVDSKTKPTEDDQKSGTTDKGENKQTDGWSENLGKNQYLKNGQPVIGWNQINDKWYLFDKAGTMQIGWKEINKVWYLLKDDGKMATGWQMSNGTWYLLKDNGEMATGWKEINGIWYLLKDDGEMAIGWQMSNGEWYYLYSDGAMASNTNIDGYGLDASGAYMN